MALVSLKTSSFRVPFSKLHGAQNDFIAIDNRENKIQLTNEQRRLMCDRHLGVGADGIMEIHDSDVADYKILHFNSDGMLCSLCGNGARCSLIFCMGLGLPMREVQEIDTIQTETPEGHDNACIIKALEHLDVQRDICEYGFPKTYYVFEAFDGLHFGAASNSEEKEEKEECFVRFQSVNLAGIKTYEDGDFFVDTGSPHHVRFVSAVENVDVEREGRSIRRCLYGEAGSNMNFVTERSVKVKVGVPETRLVARTYERGVESETKACGTGAVAIVVADVVRKLQSAIPDDMASNNKSAVDAKSRVFNEIPPDGRQHLEEPGNQLDLNVSGGKRFTRCVEMPGGTLRVHFRINVERVDFIWLQGPAVWVMDGLYRLHQDG